MSEAEMPKARTDAAGQDAVDAYLQAVHGPDTPEKQESLATPVIATGARPGEEMGVVDRETLGKKIDSVRSLQGFERLTLFRTLLDERMRLAQSVRDRPTEEKQFFELRIVAKRGHLALALHNEKRLRQFKAVEDAMRRAGIAVTPAEDLRQNMDAHLTESARAMDGLVALGNYIMLLYRLKDGKPVPRADLDEAVRRLPRTVDGRTGKAGEETRPVHLSLDPDALARRSWQEVLTDQNYIACQTALDLQLEWLLSFQKGVPGVVPEHAEENPVDVFCVDYLNRAVQATLDEEIRLGLDLKKGEERDARVKNVRDVRAWLFRERETFKRLSGETIIQFLEDTNTGIFNKKFGSETSVEPASGLEFSRMMSRLPEQRATIDQFFDQSAETFDAHRSLVEQVFSFSILNMKDWKYYVEDVHKKQFLSKVYPLIDTMVRVRAAPKVLSSQAAAAALRKFEKETGISTTYITPIVETTFKEEADKVMREIQEEWHLPKTVRIDGKEVPFDFHNDAHWAAINPEQWKEIQTSQESTMSICEQQRGDIIGKINKCQEGAALLRSLRAIQHPLDLLEVDPDEEVFRGLVERRIDAAALLADPDLKNKKPVIVSLYFFAIAEIDRNWDEYLVVSGRADAKLKETAERSLDEGRGYGNAKDLVPVPWWLVVWYASAMARAKWKSPLHPPFFRTFGRMGRDLKWVGRIALSPTGVTTRPPVRDLVDWKKKPPQPQPGSPEQIPPKRPTGPTAPKPPPEGSVVPPKAPKPMSTPAAAQEAAKPTAPRGLNALRNSRVAEELTRMRYLRGERAIAQWMQETVVGRQFARLKAFENVRGVRMAGRGLTVAAWAAIPALAYLEIKQNEERTTGAKSNPALAETYQSQSDTTLLEAGGVAAAMLAEGFLPTAVLAGTVIFTAKYSKDRAEILAGWQRTADDWTRENDSASLRQHMLDRTVSQAVEAGGGGALKPRIAFPSAIDQREAFALIQDATSAARQGMFESYIRNNTFVQGSAREERVREQMTFMRMSSEGRFNVNLNQEFLLAEAYSDLLQRGRTLVRAGQLPTLSYVDERGRQKTLDLDPLLSGRASATEVRSVVSEYVFHMQPSEELILFNAMGEIGHEKTAAVRRVLLTKLIHEIHSAERSIRAVNWPGWGFTGGEGKSQMLVRWYLASRLRQELDVAASSLLRGAWNLRQYDECLLRCRAILQEVQMAEQSGDATNQFVKKAETYFAGAGGAENVELARRSDQSKNPLYDLFRIDAESQ